MRKTYIAFLAIVALTGGYVLSTHAQWDNDEEVERLQQKQWDEAEQGGEDETEATGITTPERETKGEKTLTEWKNLPSGFLHRTFIIRQVNLAGNWDKANIFPAPEYESGWQPMDPSAYKSAMASGSVDAALKNTAFAPYYDNMQRICNTAPGATSVHMKPADSSSNWKMGQRMQRPYTIYRQLTFECLAKTN
jgi:hypothetical protein